ncbi:nicotinamide riboside transporter PnuC [Testudinibacter sp. P80/BLE/0925]|uniref:nicotinamide riboside transporter PnuC n=1 Tax=Testudinibacter sp. TW-1 TaxID=3417757 RepID=UPI003D3630A6
MSIVTKAKNELFSGWTHFEIVWIALFLSIQIAIFVIQPDSIIATIAAISGILCVIFVSKGKISNYIFGFISVTCYAYISYTFKLYGEMMLNLLVYVPVQFIGFYVWRRHMHIKTSAQTDQYEEVIAKALTLKQWGIVISAAVIGTYAYIQLLHNLGSALPALDGVTVVVSIVAQILMVLRYREQWVLWIVVNLLTVSLWTAMWIKNGETSLPLLVMYIMYLWNSIYGYHNWARMVKTQQTA